MVKSYIKGTLETIYYQNDSNYYKVLLVSVEETNTEIVANQIVVTGTFGSMQQETTYTFVGEVVEHPKYGLQFQANSYQKEEITSVNGLIYYFSSDRFPGIGTVLATRIVDTLGVGAIDLIIQESELLKTIQGLTATKRENLIEQVKRDQGENQTLLELLKYGFTDKEAFKIYQLYQDKARALIDTNPYILLESIEGIGFVKIDHIAMKMDFNPNGTERLSGAIYYVVKELSYRQGHTYFSPKTVLLAAISLLEQSQKIMIVEESLANALLYCVQTGKIIQDGERIMLPSLYFAEQNVAKRLEAIANQEHFQYPTKDIKKVIAKVQKKLNITYAPEQITAIERAISSPISVLTGGPGTGKTTVLKGIVECFALLNDIDLKQITAFDQPILLGAPTGRAAKRMSELIGLNASTLHRLLGIGLTGQEINNEDINSNELEGLLLIVDEMSMVDVWLMNWLIKAIPMGMNVILVGDKDQLPSVGPGNVLKDILLSKSIPTTQLTHIFRQTDSSSIIPLAHAVNSGYLPEDFNLPQHDRSFFECSSEQVSVVVQKVIQKALAKGYSIQDIQVLAPLYKGKAGIDALNQLVQNLVNPSTPKKREVTIFDKVLRIGDKVLQQVNVPEKNIFNGDMGVITTILTEQESDTNQVEIFVKFDDCEVSFAPNEFNQLTLAYCCSIHKAQGSEFPLVILPMVFGYGRMLRRDLLYTALTRSKQSLILCGEKEAFRLASQQVGQNRDTMLLEWLKSTIKATDIVNDELIKDDTNEKTRDIIEDRLYLENILIIDPMIGMEGITPYDFMEVSE